MISSNSALAPQRVSENDLPVVDPIWSDIRTEAKAVVDSEPVLASFICEAVLNHRSLEAALAHRIAERLHHGTLPGDLVRQASEEAFLSEPELGAIMRADIAAVYDRDPACERYLEPLLYFKGFHAIQSHRLANWLWRQGRTDFALHLQSRSSEVYQVDIHPKVPLGRGLFIDHATGVVVGSTAVIGDNVSILQGVTLGGTGKEDGDRHPKIGDCVLIGAGAKVLGNIEIGHCSRIAAGSVVLSEVPPMKTVAGVPAKVVAEAGCPQPSRSMDQILPMGVLSQL